MRLVRTHWKGCGIDVYCGRMNPVRVRISDVGGPPDNQWIKLNVGGLSKSRSLEVRASEGYVRVFGQCRVIVENSGKDYQPDHAIVGYKGPNWYQFKIIEPKYKE